MSFKGRSKDWDNDSRLERSKKVAEKIDEIIGNEKYNSIMEYGCATGLIGLNLCDKFKKVTLMDSEKEMVEIVREKVRKYDKNNIFPIQIDLVNEAYKGDKFDLIYTSLTLHHIPDTEKIYKEKNIPYSLFYTVGYKKIDMKEM